MQSDDKSTNEVPSPHAPLPSIRPAVRRFLGLNGQRVTVESYRRKPTFGFGHFDTDLNFTKDGEDLSFDAIIGQYCDKNTQSNKL